MSVCCSKECKKYKECVRADINNDGVNSATDKANKTYLVNDGNGKLEKRWQCGENGNYRLFKKVDK